MPRNDNLTFTVKPRLLRLLGDQLIRDANIAVFELVKNSYDADASDCTVKIERPDDPSHARIEVQDDGSGMDEDLLRNVWMVIATDFRAVQREGKQRSPRFGRFPLGEKGLGRLSVHKLGRNVRLVTRVKNGEELLLDFDWDRLETAVDLRHAGVNLQRRAPEVFLGNKHGTRVEITKLREAWARGELRRLFRNINSLCSPFKGPTDFEVSFSAPGRESWLEGLFSSEEANRCAVYNVKGWFEGAQAQFSYEFIPPPGLKDRLTPRKEKGIVARLEKRNGRKSTPLDLGADAVCAASIIDIEKLGDTLAQRGDLVSSFIWDRLPAGVREKIAERTEDEDDGSDAALLKSLNKIISGPPIYDKRIFAHVPLSDRTLQLLQESTPRTTSSRLNRLLLADAFPELITPGHEIGKVDFEFWLFDRDGKVLASVTDDVMGLKSYLDENGGIRIYRDGIRVYDFGEPGNDWLNLDLRRVNTPTARTSNNQILGILRLDSTTSGDLREKSNREGFIETRAYADFRDAVVSVLTNVEAEKVKDQKRLREVLGKGTGQKVFTKLSELREVLAERGELAAIEPKLKEVEKEMETYRDQLLHAAVPGLTIGIMLHGAEKILDELREAARKNAEPARIRDLVDRLYRAMRPVTNLLKNPAVAKTSASVLIKEAVFSTELRLRRHKIRLFNGTDNRSADFTIEGSKQMLVASIANLVDNSIHWLEVKNPSKKKLLISTSTELEGGPAIIVADNGPGFGNDAPEDLVEPFFSRRSGGMGLGLYIVNEVMRVNKGNLVFPSVGDVEISEDYDGAIVALQFPEIK